MKAQAKLTLIDLASVPDEHRDVLDALTGWDIFLDWAWSKDVAEELRMPRQSVLAAARWLGGRYLACHANYSDS